MVLILFQFETTFAFSETFRTDLEKNNPHNM